MDKNQAEQFRDMLETRYAECNGEEISFNDLERLNDGKNEFVVGRFNKNEHVGENVDSRGVQREAFDSSKMVVFAMLLENGELVGESVTISAESESKHLHKWVDRDGPEEKYCGGKTDLTVRIGKKPVPWSDEWRGIKFGGKIDEGLYLRRTEKGAYREISSETLTTMFEHSMRENMRDVLKNIERIKKYDSSLESRISLRNYLKKSVKQQKKLENLFKKFVGPVISVDEIVKEEQKAMKRAERFGKLRKLVEKKRAKFAETQKKMKEKEAREQRIASQNQINKFFEK